MKPQENERPSRTRRTKLDEPGEDEGKCEGVQDEEKKKLKRRKPSTRLPTTVKSEIKQLMAIGAGSLGAEAVLGKRRPRSPARRMNQNLPVSRRTVSIS